MVSDILRSVLLLFSLGKVMNQFWKVKSNPEAVEKPLQNPFWLWERTFWAALLTIYKSFLLFMIVYLTNLSKIS